MPVSQIKPSNSVDKLHNQYARCELEIISDTSLEAFNAMLLTEHARDQVRTANEEMIDHTVVPLFGAAEDLE